MVTILYYKISIKERVFLLSIYSKQDITKMSTETLNKVMENASYRLEKMKTSMQSSTAVATGNPVGFFIVNV